MVLILSFINKKMSDKPDYESQQSINIGGEFLLYNHNGETVSARNLLGKYTMVLFGFSRCPHICPTQLGIVSTILHEINNSDLQAFFISIDPENDDVETLKIFHEKFDERIQMLTGSMESIKQVISDYKVYVSMSDNPENINHSTILYVMDKNGKYIEHLNLNNSSVSDNINSIRGIINKK